MFRLKGGGASGEQAPPDIWRIGAVVFFLVGLVLGGWKLTHRAPTEYIQIDGQEYAMRRDLCAYLLLGVDTEGSLREVKSPGSAGQSDAMYLLVCDMRKKTAQVLGIPRDTMTEIEVYLPGGKYNGSSTDHLTLQYAFGDGREKSCQLVEDAVSRLLFGIPIRGYLAVNLGAVPELADAVGGVEVTVPDDSASAEESSFRQGAVVTLDSHNVKKFLRFRDTEVSWSAATRMERHKAFFRGFAKRLRDLVRENPAAVLQLYEKCSPHVLTDISVEEFAELAGMSFEEEIEILPGTYTRGDEYEEFYIDEEALRELVLRIFCGR